MNNIGLYLHIPFCASKCPYCDFYSFRGSDDEKSIYVNALLREIELKFNEFNCKADTLYIGGGTPSVLTLEQICELVEQSKKCFVTPGAEITVECNPYSLDDNFFNEISKVGVNRISLGLQSANDNERKKLGRRASIMDIEKAIGNARKAGIENISLDVMLGVPDSNLESLKTTLEFCVSQDIPHVSCYILKLEENTPFYKMKSKLNFPDDDLVSDMYLYMVDYLESHGIMQYEISNFAKPGYESKHNLKYWNCEDYLGLGASAHSFINGKRFYYQRNIKSFIDGNEPIFDCEGGDFEEYTMLSLRLVTGLENRKVTEKFGYEIPEKMYKKADKFQKLGLLECDERGIRLNKKGFLVSNYIISELI